MLKFAIFAQILVKCMLILAKAMEILAIFPIIGKMYANIGRSLIRS